MSEEEIKCMDTDGVLEVWNYTECSNSSPESVKRQRGLIKDTDGNLVVHSFGYTDEYTHADVETVRDKMADAEWIFHYSVEGTLLRMFYENNQWYLSTHKKLNAFKSRWSCKQTFGELLEQGLDDVFLRKGTLAWLQEQLPTTHVYFFLVRSNAQNRIVCQTHHLQKNETVVFLGHYARETEPTRFVFYEKGQTTDDLAVLRVLESPPPLPSPVATVEELCGLVSTLDPFVYQGVIGFRKDGMESFKVLHTDYVKYYSVRGTNPNLRFRYLELRNQPDQVQLLYVLYPKYTMLFDEYEGTLFEIAKVIYQFYVNRYIKNQYITLPREEYVVLKKCHEWYLQDRKNNRIFTQKVLEILANETPLNLYKMIRRFNYDRDLKHRGPLPYARTDMRIEIPVYNQKKNQEFMASLPPLSPPHSSSNDDDV